MLNVAGCDAVCGYEMTVLRVAGRKVLSSCDVIASLDVVLSCDVTALVTSCRL